MQLAACFGFAALILALIGIYGVVSYTLEQRKRELGVRLALGARHAELLPLILKYGLVPVLLGLGCGLVLSIAVGGLVRALTFGVTPNDPVTMASVSLLLILSAAVACVIPATRIIRLEPASILRHE
jgi:putative ABC transport system permease protein